jgi:uncharacterized protein YuzE
METAVERGICVHFAPHSDAGGSAVVAPCIEDLDEAGATVGFEIFGLRRAAGARLLEGVESARTHAGEKVRFHYESACDALYLRLSASPARDQLETDCVVVRDREGRLVRLEFDPRP